MALPQLSVICRRAVGVTLSGLDEVRRIFQ